MGYNECFTYTNCDHSTVHANYIDTCETTYTNYLDCEVAYDDHNNWDGTSTSHYNYANCEVAHYDYSNHCNTYTNYSNHTNYTRNPQANSGAALSLYWNPSNWSGNTIVSTYIQGSISALKELRANMKRISTEKSQQSATVDLETTSLNIGDPQFDAPFSDGSGQDYVEDNQYDALRDSLNNLWASIKGDDDATTPGTTDRATGDKVQRTDWQLLKQKTDELAAYPDTADYLNHINYTGTGSQGGGEHTNHTNYV